MSWRDRISGYELLTNAEMAAADAVTIKAGTDSYALMKRAGEGAAHIAHDLLGTESTVILLCGPGNNGGDGFIIAKALAGAGHFVSVWSLKSPGALKGDAAKAAKDWDGRPAPLDDLPWDTADIIIDALFGTGLDRPVEGDPAKAIEKANAADCIRLAVDIPSGVGGDDGAIVGGGAAFHADITVTFARRKRGHALLPGRALCGLVHCIDIGIADETVQNQTGDTPPVLNHPGVWGGDFPRPDPAGHKFDRGHVLVLGGPRHASGAARLAARSALRSGAGLVTAGVAASAADIYAAHQTGVMITSINEAEDIPPFVRARKVNTVLIGPGFGVGARCRGYVETLAGLKEKPTLVLDADALTSFADRPEALFSLRGGPCVLTPHEGEFARLFPDLDPGMGRIEAACKAAEQANAIVVLKGGDTVIADAKGRIFVNTHTTPYLATAGSGDVLAGIIAGLAAQAMPAFKAAAAAVWLHGDMGLALGPGLVSEDLPEALPDALASL